jgi:outer membrane autotransporter protein
MKTTIARFLSTLRSAAGKFTLLALLICAPVHAAFAQNTISIAGGDNQTGNTNTQLPNPLTVSFSGNATVTLDWQVNGDAFFQSTGTATLQQTLTTMPGSTSGVNLDLGNTVGSFTVTATCSQGCTGAPQFVNFKVNVTASQPFLQMQVFSGNQQTGAPNTTLAQPLVVTLTTAPGFDGPSDISLQWSIDSGSASFTANHQQSFSQTVTVPVGGQSSTTSSQVSIDLGPTPGAVLVSVVCSSCDSGSQRLFRLTNVASATLQKISGDNQTGAVGSASDAPLVVQLGPAGSGSLSGQPINWSVISGQATLSSAGTQTDPSGLSSITFHYGSNPGPVTIEASSASGKVDFTATAVQSSTNIVSGNNQTGKVGGALQPFTIQVTSSGVSSLGKGLDQIPVTWTIAQGGGTLAASTTLTDATGKSSNTLTLGPNVGTNIVQATITGIGTVTFTAVATVNGASGNQFTIVSGNNQALIPGQVSKAMVVKLLSSQGQAVAGETVLWSVSGSSGTLANPSTPTDTNGQAQNQLTVILPGSYTVTAKLADDATAPALTFNFNNAVSNLPTLSATQTSVAHAIDKACPALAAMPASQLTFPQQDLLQRCSEIVVASGNNAQQVPNALTQMLNNKALPQNQLANTVQMSQFGNLNTRLAELRQGAQGFSIHGLALAEDGKSLPLATLGDAFHKDPAQANDEVGKDFERWGFFATGMIERGGFSADNARPGFDFHNASLTAGVDYRFSDALVAGAAVGYNQSNSSLDLNFGKIDVDSYSLSGYFTWYHNNDFYVEGSVVQDWLNYDLSRNIAYQIADLSGSGLTTVNNSASASPDGHQTALSLSVGKDFNRGAWTISPYVRGDYTHVNLSAFSETVDNPNSPGAGLGTQVASRSFNSELGVLGGRFSYTTSFDWGVLVPNATIEWNHQFKNDPQVLVTRFLADPTQTPIVITSDAPDQNYFNVGIGLNAVLPKGRSGYVSWEHLVGFAGAHENRFSLGVRIEF